MRRAVITGIGIVSAIGNNRGEVTESLREGTSGIRFCETYRDLGFRSHIHGAIRMDPDTAIDRRLRRFMGDGAVYNYVAMEEAIADAGLEAGDISNERTGLVMGSGGPSTRNQVLAADLLRDKGTTRKIGPFMVPRTMSSTNSATLADAVRHQGRQLFDHFGLFDQRPLHRQRAGADPARQAGYRVRRRRRGTALVAVDAVRRHAGIVRRI